MKRPQTQQGLLGRFVLVVLVGFAAGAIAGHFAGVLVRSDNLPFFAAVGAVIGLSSGLIAALFSRRG